MTQGCEPDPRAARGGPELCVWETTLACNLVCSHCGSSAGCARPRELDTTEAYALIDALSAIGTRELTLSGGELFVRPDWSKLIAHARARGLECLVVSNGLAVTRAAAEELGRLEVSSVSLSIDGDARIHDSLRPLNRRVPSELSGPSRGATVSSYEQLGWAIENLHAAGVTVAAITQVSMVNLGALPSIYELLAARRIEGWQIQMMNAMGRGAGRVPMLELAALPELYAFVRRVQEDGRVRCLAADCIGYFGADESLLRSVDRPHDGFWQGCQAGIRVVGVTSDGGVKGCLSMPDAFLEGNIRERPFADIWNAPRAFAYNRHFDVESLTGGCRGCAFGKLCRAGCHSFAATAQAGDISRYDHCIRIVGPSGR